MRRSTYKAAKAVAAKMQEHFRTHHAAATDVGKADLAHSPSSDIIETIIDAAFWASLRKEEGRSPKLSIAYVSPDQVKSPLLFEKPLPLDPHILTKIAPGFERAGVHLGVYSLGEELVVWGSTHSIPSYCFVLDVSEPGLLVVKHRREEEFGKFSNVAVLNGDEIKIVDENSALLPDCPTLLTSLLGVQTGSANFDSVNVLVQLAVSMRSHGRGGAVIIVPTGSNEWKNSIRQPINYPIHPAFTGLAEVLKTEKHPSSQNDRQVLLKREVDAIAGLTAIDGAIIMNDQYQLLAFGAKIIRAKNSSVVEHLMETEPIVGGMAMVVQAGQNGGTRHSSAAQFVFDQHDAMALVASQDGRFTVFTWSPCENMVHAHRIEVLLL